jgi:prepilin-type N-terminal cleavage/methylation domain-containing protein
MKNAKGFTLIEMMVGSVVLLVVLVIATSFFRMQTKFGGQLVKDSGTRETIATAMMLIKRDIMHAGRGVSNTHQLAFWPTAYSDLAFHELYVNYSYFMPNVVKSSYNVFTTYSAFKSENPLVLPNTLSQDVYGVMTYNSSSKARQVFQATGTTTGTSTSFTISGSTGSLPFTPVVFWQLVDPSTSNDVPPYSSAQPELRRNGLCIAGGSLDHNLRLQNFGIRCQFIDAGGTETWIPSSSNSDFSAQTFDNLKVIEVQLKYQTLKAGENETKSYNWMQQYSKIMNVTSRNIYIMANSN